MRAVALISFCLTACLSVKASATLPDPVLGERALREECSTGSQADLRDCLEKKAEGSQKALRQAEAQMASTLSKWDEDEKYIRQAKARLAASNTAFAKYRNSQCALASSLGCGAIGNALDMRRFACGPALHADQALQAPGRKREAKALPEIAPTNT